ncbi:zinc-ribbon and DUF3426 domain-containing protein [Roseateles terrae]|uniref:Zn finger-like uncharacterized protein n=1 Tax=Roseateles terrae TaxID=431060 RepID=A0ABR6GT54_9BURK|nr:zinc-ribbon and DUF3426 domain-containing protein [Roseateles terrae]MBB3195278.1 putative Zn finger-like uncharacterized protein [Roseateles terrae]OWQ87281.1 hypothetical protein CDN98_10635 [Roseateles terrae]
MNLATRCTTCGTIFRVVQDQLRVSEGWVRCGRCAEVFDAREQLFDLERDSPPPWPPVAASGAAAPRQPALPPAPAPMTPQPAPDMSRAMSPSAGALPSPMAPAMAPVMPAPTPRELAAPRYQPDQGPTTFPSQSMAAAFDDVPRRTAPVPMEAPRDSGWIPNDDNELNPFSPSRPLPGDFDDDGDSLLPSTPHYSRPRTRPTGGSGRGRGPAAPEARQEPAYESAYDEDRVEPFLSAAPGPAPVEDPRSHLPEPKGMRFEEDELPPPVADDERPDVLLNLSGASAARLQQQEPMLDPRVPVRAPVDPGEPSLMPGERPEVPLTRAERKAAEKAAAREAAEAARLAKLEAKEAERAAKEAREAEKEAEKQAARAAKEAEKLAIETRKAAEKAAQAEARIKSREASDAAASVPSFVRKAESAQRWHRPWVRATLGTAALGLLVGVAGQIAWTGREAIAAQYPFARPMLSKMTTAMGQELKPWQHIEALSVESSSLNPAGEGNHYRLTLSLRNRSNWDVAQPWVDLSLTDPSGQLVVRKMLSPQELHATQPAFTAGADQQLQVVFDSGNTKISGYTVELFYP